MKKDVVNIGLLGLGTVGSGVVRIVEGHQEDLRRKTGYSINIAKVLVRDLNKNRNIFVSPEKMTDNPRDVLYDSDIDVIIEVMGGTDTAYTYIKEALEQGKHVITANKDLMALHGRELLELAQAKRCDLYYEASVAGGIPIIRSLVDGLASDRITKIIGIVNGTTNYILTKMSQEGAAFEDVLQEAQALGYAEADPTADVEGLDAARKMAILGTLGFHVDVDLDDVDVTGITKVTPEDITYAKQLGYEMKLLGIAKRDDGCVEFSVQPTMISLDHPLANVSGVFNAVYVYGEAVGETMFYGPGAGDMATGTAVVSDLVAVLRNLRAGVNGQNIAVPYQEKRLKSPEQIFAKYYLRINVVDRAGVLAKITQLFAENNVSLEKVLQVPYNGGEHSEIVIITHEASKYDFERVLEGINALDIVKEVRSSYRVEGSE